MTLDVKYGTAAVLLCGLYQVGHKYFTLLSRVVNAKVIFITRLWRPSKYVAQKTYPVTSCAVRCKAARVRVQLHWNKDCDYFTAAQRSSPSTPPSWGVTKAFDDQTGTTLMFPPDKSLSFDVAIRSIGWHLYFCHLNSVMNSPFDVLQIRLWTKIDRLVHKLCK